MPIGGFVITVAPEEGDSYAGQLAERSGFEVHGSDERGNIVAVIETETSDEMDQLVAELEKDPRVLSVGLTYLNAEDEIEKIASGEIKRGFPFGRKKHQS